MGSASLATRLAQEIAAGRWSEGETLPGVRQLALQVGCSPGTVARAYAALRDSEVLAGSPRSRFFVAAGGPARAAGSRGAAEALRLAGSDDPALDVLVRAVGGAVSVVPGPRGSVRGAAIRIGPPGAGSLPATVKRVSPGAGHWDVTLDAGETLRGHVPLSEEPPRVGEPVAVQFDLTHLTVIPE